MRRRVQARVRIGYCNGGRAAPRCLWMKSFCCALFYCVVLARRLVRGQRRALSILLGFQVPPTTVFFLLVPACLLIILSSCSFSSKLPGPTPRCAPPSHLLCLPRPLFFVSTRVAAACMSRHCPLWRIAQLPCPASSGVGNCGRDFSSQHGSFYTRVRFCQRVCAIQDVDRHLWVQSPSQDGLREVLRGAARGLLVAIRGTLRATLKNPARPPYHAHTWLSDKSPILSLWLLDLVVTKGCHRSSDGFSAICLTIGCPLATSQRSEPLSHPA